MIPISVRAVRQGQDRYQVKWQHGRNRYGVFDVECEVHLSSDHLAMVELAALKRLLLIDEVQGYPLYGGEAVVASVSQGAIKKLAQGRSSKRHLYPFSSFLRRRLLDIEVRVDKRYLSLENGAPATPWVLTEQEAMDPCDQIDTPTMGVLAIRPHAVDQYARRFRHDEQVNQPWRSLIKRLQHPELHRRRLSDKVLKHKARKYGTSDNVEVWAHPSSELHFLVLNEANRRTLVTVYRRSEE